MSERARRALPWPLFTIDFEASSLVPGSYPIEVGVARWAAPDRPIGSWSTLIRPIPLWRTAGSWSAEAEAVHGLRRDELDEGLDPPEVLSALNRIVGTHAAFCDGGESDFGWARRLVLAAGFMNTFRMGDVDMLTGRCDADGFTRMVRWLDANPAPHRAGPDAERLMLALAHGFGLKPDVEPLRLEADPMEGRSARCNRIWTDGFSINDPRTREVDDRTGEISTLTKLSGC